MMSIRIRSRHIRPRRFIAPTVVAAPIAGGPTQAPQEHASDRWGPLFASLIVNGAVGGGAAALCWWAIAAAYALAVGPDPVSAAAVDASNALVCFALLAFVVAAICVFVALRRVAQLIGEALRAAAVRIEERRQGRAR